MVLEIRSYIENKLILFLNILEILNLLNHILFLLNTIVLDDLLELKLVIKMILPKTFIIHGHTIKVIIKDIDNKEDNRYGYYDSVKEEIVIFKQVRSEGEPVQLTDTQIEATFWHELAHCFEWHMKGSTDEWFAQCFAGLMTEFIKTSNIKIDPHVIHEPLTSAYND